MIRLAIILAIMAAGMPAPVMAVTAADSPSVAKCCCCPTGACQCGCETPANSQPRDPEDQSKGLSICGCDASPLAPPAPRSETDTRLALSGTVSIENQRADIGVSGPMFRGHQPHGPPPAVEILSTIILLT